jgi:phosphoenolpyruvate carboxykinase (diphosphate)
MCEEEHAGGTFAYARFSLGDKFYMDSRYSKDDHTFAEMVSKYGGLMDVQPEGYAIDKQYPDVIYVPENVHIDLNTQRVYWEKDGIEQEITLSPTHTYVNPDGYKVHMEKHPGAPSWRLVGTGVEGTFCHKPCTVSGGGKSEISKSLLDAVHYGPFFVADLKQDLDRIEEITAQDFSNRFRDKSIVSKGRPLLASNRSLGSVIRLLTPSEEDYTDEYNAWLATIPDYLKAMIFIIKRFYRPEWGDNWRAHFSADLINGKPGHELKYNGRKLVASYLRVGLLEDGSWRTYKLRQDFLPAAKIQKEDDISASTVVPAETLANLDPEYHNPSLKLVENCEMRLFQRPDEAIHRGHDKQTEHDLAEDGNFISNFAPLAREDAVRLQQQTIAFHAYTEPMRDLVNRAATSTGSRYFVSSAHPRIVDGEPTKNPRYLQLRPDLADPREKYIGEVATRLHRRVPIDQPVIQPVNAVLPGRRNNPPDRKAGIRPLAVYNPIHYQELPELFMDFICSLTGKSPSTTGAGSEGALTKGPFNCLTPTSDLNNALVSYILTGYHAFSTAAGYIGPHYRMDHDVSLLIPEVWCRLSEKERDPEHLIATGCLEKVEDFDHNGQTILASRLGYRITRTFLNHYFGRVFDSPTTVFNDEMLQPETQDLEAFADGINNITEAQRRCAQAFFDDGSIDAACPPLAALLHIMVHGHCNGKGVEDPEVRRLFTRDYLLESDWYQERLKIKQDRDCALWRRHILSLSEFLERPHYGDEAERLDINGRLVRAKAELKRLEQPEYLASLNGTLGADPLCRKPSR